MKKPGSTSDFIGQRNKELRSKFFSLPFGPEGDDCVAARMERAVKSPTSRFWVDPDRARDTLSRIRRDPGVLDLMTPGRREMYRELYSRYLDIQKERPKASMIECVTEAIFSEAPEFFISPRTARSILSRMTRV